RPPRRSMTRRSSNEATILPPAARLRAADGGDWIRRCHSVELYRRRQSAQHRVRHHDSRRVPHLLGGRARGVSRLRSTGGTTAGSGGRAERRETGPVVVMRRPEFIARLSGCPTGVLGSLIARIMAKETLATNTYALRLLELQPTDHVLEVGFGHG